MKTLWSLIVLCILLFPVGVFAAPSISSITADQGIGDTIVITGTDFGSAGYVKICGLSVTATLWNTTSITLTIPDGAHSGEIIVVDNGGIQSEGYQYTINYRDDISSTWKVTDPNEFTIKDVGFSGAANLIESEPGWLYLYAIPMIKTYDISSFPATLHSSAWTPSRAADMELYGDYIFITGGFGVEIYNTADLQAGGFTAINAPVTAGWTGVGVDSNDTSVRLKYIAINEFTGTPINGTLLALTEFNDTTDPLGVSRVFFFSWDASTETLTYLATLNDSHLNGQLVFVAGLWPHATVPKLIVIESDLNFIGVTRVNNVLTAHEFNISNLSSISYIGEEILDTTNHVAQDLKMYNNRAWIALYGAGKGDNIFHVGGEPKAFIALDLSPTAMAVETTYINACSSTLKGETCNVDSDCLSYILFGRYCVDGYCVTPCTTDFDCTYSSLGSGEGAPIGTEGLYRCDDKGECQFCRTEHAGSLDLIPGTQEVVGGTGMSTDETYRHNMFIFNAEATSTEHFPLASSETTDWSMDVTGHEFVIASADEWTNCNILEYTDTPDFEITHHTEPAWEDSKRIFSPGWYTSIPWIQNERVHSGQNSLHVADIYDLSNTTTFFNYNQTNLSPYAMIMGTPGYNNDYAFGMSFFEDFLVIDAGTFMTVAYLNPITGEVKYLNNPGDNAYYTDGCNWPSGDSMWIEKNVVISTMGMFGIFGFYVVPDNPARVSPPLTCTTDAECEAYLSGSKCINLNCEYGTIEERTVVEDGLDCRIIVTRFASSICNAWGDIAHITGNTYAIANQWRISGVLPVVPDTDWGGLYFFDVTYENGNPPTPTGDPDSEIYITASTIPQLNSLYGVSVERIEVKEIDGDQWILATLMSYNSAPFVEREEGEIALINYSDLEDLNNACKLPGDLLYDEGDCTTQRESYTIRNSQFDPPIWWSMDIDSVFWEKDGDILIAVIAQRGEGVQQETYKSGVFVFAPNGPTPGFDIDNIDQDNVYFIPMAYLPNKKNFPVQFTRYSDINVKLLPDPSNILNLPNNDLIIIGTSGAIIRVGDPSECALDIDCDDGDICTTDTCGVDFSCSNVVAKDTDGDGYIDDACAGGTDCDDTLFAVNPGELEGPINAGTCVDLLDNDCDTFIDALDPGCSGAGTPRRLIIIGDM